MIDKQQITGLILAGGRGRRLSGEDKGLLNYHGKRLIELQIEKLIPQVVEIVISANRNIQQYQGYGYKVLVDQFTSFEGPLSGIYSGLEQCNTDWLFVQPVDVPNLPSDLIEQLLKSSDSTNQGFYLKSPERAHYLSMMLHKDLAQDLKQQLSNRRAKVSEFLLKVGIKPHRLKLAENLFKNINHLDDF